MRFYAALTFALIIFSAVSPACARMGNTHSGDMFYDRHWVYDRPAVPSDRGRSADVFRPIPVMYNSNADMFDHTKPRVTYGREDIFPTRMTRMPRPYHTLTIDPPQGPYNAR